MMKYNLSMIKYHFNLSHSVFLFFDIYIYILYIYIFLHVTVYVMTHTILIKHHIISQIKTTSILLLQFTVHINK